MTYRLVLFALLLGFPGPAFNQENSMNGYIPKPVFTAGCADPVISLAGEWIFSPNPGRRYWDQPRTIPSNAGKIQVPGEWVMQGFTVEPGKRAAYFREVEIPSDWKNKRIILKCDGLYSDAIVFLNGKEAGSHQGGFTPAEFDLTELVVPGRFNQLVIGLISESLADTLASASQYAAHPLGGITRKIQLMAIPLVSFSGCRIETDLDDQFKDAFLKIGLDVVNQTSEALASLTVEVTLTSLNPENKSVQREFKIPQIFNGETSRNEYVLRVFKPDKWDPEHPNLYQVRLDLKNKDQLLETAEYRIGFREIQLVGNRVFVNGMPIKLRGVCRHEVHPLKGRSLTKKEWLQDALLFRDANVNYIRTSHYPPAEEFIAFCDSLGLFVEVEAPLCWIGHGANAHWLKNNPDNPKLYPLILQQINETISQYRNHPSVLMWSLANESKWGPNWEKVLKVVANTDPTRLISFHDQAYGGFNNFGSTIVPVANFHYPGPVGPMIAEDFQRPLLFGEYCHLNCYNRQEIAADPAVREAWGRGFESMFNDMYYSRGNLGGAIWSGIDDIFHLPSGKAVGYGEWGPIDGWRRPKPEYWHVKKTYSPVRIFIKVISLPQAGQPIRIPVENRYLFSNLSEMEFRWKTKSSSGIAVVFAEPAQTGLLNIFVPGSISSKDTLAIDVWSPGRYLVDQYKITFESGQNNTLTDFIGSPVQFNRTGNILTVTSGSDEWVFDAITGALMEAGQKGNLVLTGDIGLQILPLTTGPCVTDYQLDIIPLNEIKKCVSQNCTGFGLSDGKFWITTDYSFEGADLKTKWTIQSGQSELSYEIRMKEAVDPRQIGIVFTLPRNKDLLAWSRNALWSVYPDNHIGRPEGHARPFSGNPNDRFRFGVQPDWNWSQDALPEGSNDFRSTRENINWVNLTDSLDRGVKIMSDGSDAARCWLNGQYVKLLVAGFTTGGGDLFFSSHHEKERKPLKPGDVFNDKVTIILD